MVKKGDLKTVALVVAGVIAAGFLMNQFRTTPVIGDAREGFN